jgi:hypothetical protein
MIRIEEIKGLEKVRRNIEARLRRFEQSSLRKALQAFAEPIRAHAERLAQSLISPRMKVGVKIKIRGSTGTVVIGPTTDTFEIAPDGKSVSFANIGYWFEFGYDIRHTPKGPALHHVGARPFLTPAYQAQKENGLAAFDQVMRDALEEEVEAA